MPKSIIYDNDAKTKLLSGVTKLEKAVACTLGPAGKNVIVDEYGSIHSTKDGVTVAKSVVLEDRFENLGANAIKEVAEKSNTNVGDGTTTSTVLAASIFRNGLRQTSFGANATFVKNGIKKAADITVEYLKSISKKIETAEDIRRVAKISANGDDKIGSTISDMMAKIGNDGTIKVEDGKGIFSSKVVEGMVLDRSYISPYMATNPETLDAEIENPFVLICDKKLSNIQELLPCLQSVAATGRPLFVIAESYQEDISATLIMTAMKGNLRTVAIEAPSYGENRKAMLEDIAVMTGGRVVSDSTGTKLEHAVAQMVGKNAILGQAAKVVVTRNNTVIIGGMGDKACIESRIASIRKQIDDAEDEFDREKLRERLAKLTSGIGIIYVGAATEVESKELRDRVDDAFAAAKAAAKGGIVPGGGVALLMAKRYVDSRISEFEGDERTGAMILRDSLNAPINKILENSGMDPAEIVSALDKISGEQDNAGYDVVGRRIVDMIEAGIIDPTDVVVNEVQNAASVAGLLLTTECLVVETPEKKN